jgi:hypothetical protein
MPQTGSVTIVAVFGFIPSETLTVNLPGFDGGSGVWFSHAASG